MNAELKIKGIAELEAAIENAEKKTVELKKAVAEIHIALANMGVEAHQPTDNAVG